MSSSILEYDEKADTLVFRKQNEGVVESINDRYICIIDLNKQRQIVGLEFLNARKTFNIPLEILRNLRSGTVHIAYDPRSKLMYVNITLVYDPAKPEKIAVPISADLGTKEFIEEFRTVAVADA